MLLHLSDLHFGTEQPVVVQALMRLCEQLSPEAVVVSGDLTQRATQEQFVAAKAFLDSLALPYLVVAGNHDLPLFHVTRRLLTPFHLFHQVFGELEPTLITPHFALIGVNSITRHHHTKGSFSPWQIWHTGQRIAQQPADKQVLVVSHQPFMVTHAVDQEDVPRLMQSAVQHWSHMGAKGFLHGHLHVPAVFDLAQHFALLVERPVLDVQAGTSMSTRLRRGVPNSVNLIHPDLTIERWDFDGAGRQFVHQHWLWHRPIA